MLRYVLLGILICGVVSAESPNMLTEKEQKEGYRRIFDGETLDGWKGDAKLWSVVDGAIVGSTEGNKIPHNSFLISEEKFSDFILRLDVKVRNHNSGVQFRSEELPNPGSAGLSG